MDETAWRREPIVIDDANRFDRRAMNRVVAWLTLLFWAFNVTVLTFGNLMDAVPDWEIRATARLLAAAGGIMLCYLIHLTLSRWGGSAFGRRATLAFILSIVAGDLYSWMAALSSAWMVGEPIQTLTGRGLVGIAYAVWFFLAWTAMYLALSYSAEVRWQERRWAELRDLAHATQLRALSYQIRPHFLFNTLNSIAALVLDRRTQDADAMIRRLSDFLRVSLAIDPLRNIRLDDEVALQRLYLEIEQVRYPDLDIAIDVPDAVRRARLPALILQPIVENAVKYAVSDSDAPALISIRARQVDDALEVLVEDTGALNAPATGGSGIGLRNVRERLREQYGDRQSMEAGPVQPRGFRVRLRMPLEVEA